MSERSERRGFAARPTNQEAWIKAADATAPRAPDDEAFTARMTIDVTPALRGRIKIAAFRRGVTVADMLREMLAREFPHIEGDPHDRRRGPRARGGPTPTARHQDNLTHVELTWVEKKIENWIRFGTHAHEQILDRRRRVLSFRPGAVFAFVRWASNDFGTIISRIDVVRSVARGETYQTLPFVRPGGEILLKVESWPRVERVLQAIDAIERIGIDPEAVSPDHWRHVHNRLAAGHEPRTYTLDHHRAFLLRRKAES